MTEIELTSTQELIDEIAKRFDCYIFYGTKRNTKDVDIYVSRYGGGKPACVGLCDLLKDDIIIHKREEFDDEKLQKEKGNFE